MQTYYFLVNDHSDEHTIASTEANSPEEALSLLWPLYKPYSLTWLRHHTEEPSQEKGGRRSCFSCS